jgi:hypothetical protein
MLCASKYLLEFKEAQESNPSYAGYNENLARNESGIETTTFITETIQL